MLDPELASNLDALFLLYSHGVEQLTQWMEVTHQDNALGNL